MLPLAAAIELIHTYSLIHDDLPAMDDDDLRRGRPTCHVKFGEDVAILAGDALYAEAFRHLLTAQAGEPARRARRRRASWPAATGVDGMVGGQYLDVAERLGERRRAAAPARAEDRPADRRRRCECVLLAGSASTPRRLERSARFAAELGVLFQIVDDILDVTGTDAALGKPQGSDERHGKRTYVSEFGLERRARAGRASRHASARAALRAGRAGRRDRARADHRLHPHPHLMSDAPDRSSTASTARRTSTASPTTSSPQVAQEVREHIIDTVGEIGGHFGANLGTCELAVALHSLLDSPRDKILWDVGHQAYPHKVLTGRRDQLPTIRQYEGLAPFCSIAESEHDIMGAGHASTSIGYAVGIKEAMRRAATADDGQGRRRDRRRRDDRRRRVRGDPPGRRARARRSSSSSTTTACRSRRTSARCRATSTACA